MSSPALPEAEYHLTLLRHGESIGNAEGYYQGQSDFPLSPVGEAQAVALAARWQAEGVGFDLVITSPLTRARRTAEIIASALNTPLEIDPILLERSAGLLEGLHEQEAKERFPQLAFIPLYAPIGVTGESRWELFLRAGEALNQLLKRPAGRYLVVAHGALLNMLLYAALGIFPQPDSRGAHFAFDNTGFAQLVYYAANHYWYVKRLNDLAHLADEPAK
ncbi:MAG: histidine phosphatase family protein [Anaerolineales bacterium]|nr:histidine phosphatase family protein [Anaerolineales bacterium]